MPTIADYEYYIKVPGQVMVSALAAVMLFVYAQH
jgi:hypothetical protein